MIDQGLYVPQPEFERFTTWKREYRPPWAKATIKLREVFNQRRTTEQRQETRKEELEAAIRISGPRPRTRPRDVPIENSPQPRSEPRGNTRATRLSRRQRAPQWSAQEAICPSGIGRIGQRVAHRSYERENRCRKTRHSRPLQTLLFVRSHGKQ